MSVCAGNSEDHCCWLNGVVCPHLEENTVPGRRWACGLLRQHGTWDAVYQTDEYKDVLGNAIEAGLGEDFRCGSWPPAGESCATCGISG